jgi:hypothetical protein
MSIILPDIIIESTIQSCLDYIVADWNANATKSDTYLYKVWNGVIHGKYNYYEQAQELFLRTDADPNKLRVYSFYPQDKIKPPMMVINVPSENLGGDNKLGFGEGDFSDTFIDEDALTYQNQLSRSFDWTYSISTFASGRNESNLIYNTIKALLIACKDHLDIAGLKNIKFSGVGMQLNKDTGNTFFVRTLNISGFTEMIVPELADNQMIQDFIYNQTTSDFTS